MLPLHMASLGGYTDCCRKLISYGELLALLIVVHMYCSRERSFWKDDCTQPGTISKNG